MAEGRRRLALELREAAPRPKARPRPRETVGEPPPKEGKEEEGMMAPGPPFDREAGVGVKRGALTLA